MRAIAVFMITALPPVVTGFAILRPKTAVRIKSSEPSSLLCDERTGTRLQIATDPTKIMEPYSTRTTVRDVWGVEPNLANFPDASFVLGGGGRDDGATSPPILKLPNFLTSEECERIKHWAVTAIESGAEECDDYLNFRVNKEVGEGGESEEGKALIDECGLEESALSAKHCGGFRVRLDTKLIDEMFKSRILDVLGFSGQRDFVYEEGLWVRPSPRTVCIRDQTVVFYNVGDGVPPHVDGKDATLLVYLSDVPDGVGGRTVFPEDNFAQTPVQGTALLYRSMTELLHYSEAMQPGNEKWIMQLLIDFNHNFKPGDTVTDFRTGTSYVWDGN